MRKSKKNNKKKLSTYKKAYPFLLLLATLFMGIGYAKIGDIDLLISGLVTTSEHKGIIITEANLLQSTETGTGSIVNFNDTLLTTNIALQENNNSTVTFEVSIANNADDGLTHYFSGVNPDGYDADFYPNKYITHELNGLSIGDALAYKEEVTFTITFKYKENADFSAYDFTNTLKSYLVFNFDGISMNQAGSYEYVVPKTGNYQLEVWGASGYSYTEEYHGGYGGYSTGKIYLEKGTTLYVYTGGQGVGGNVAGTYPGGFNGGGNGVLDNNSKYTGSGGGATHIALVDGELSTLANNVNDILIVAGGGGAVYHENNYVFLGGHGGGIEGTGGIQIKDTGALNGPVRNLAGGGTQNAGGTAGETGAVGAFGQGGEKDELSIGGGGGFYGGGTGWATSSGGGSGYIGNADLFDKHMIVYNETPETTAAYTPAVTSDATATATNAVISYNTEAISDVAKSGDGFAKILYLDGETDDEVVVEDTVTIFGIEHTVIDANPTLTTSSNNSNDASGLYASTDTNTGAPTYYFRGNVTNNYVTFAGFTWRIVRVNEDGTIRLVTQEGIANGVFNNNVGDYTYMYYTNSNNNNNAMLRLETWYTNNIANNQNYLDKVVTGNYFCEQAKVKFEDNDYSLGNADMVLYSQYGANYTNDEIDSNHKPSFTCVADGNGKGLVNSGIGLLTYDEVTFAGGYYTTTNTEYYLYNNQLSWLMSPAGMGETGAQAWRIDTNASNGFSGGLAAGRVSFNRYFRPVINIKPDVTVEGNGTEGNPFVIQ